MEEKFDILEIAKELNAVVVVDEDAKENIDDETIKDIEKHNELMEKRREKAISTEEDNEEWLNKLKSCNEIVGTISSYLSLNRKGDMLWACCPFHHEKTPSFAVYEQKQFYHCFGCGDSGDVIKFVSKMENCSYLEGIKILAEKCGMELPTELSNDKAFDINKWEEETQKEIVEELEDFEDEDDYHNDYDLDEKEDVNNCPENLINEIFGFMESYHPDFKEQVSEYFRNEQKVKDAIDDALKSIPDKEAKIIKNYYMEGKSLNEIAKEKKKTTNQIIDLKESALRKLRNPKRARNFRPFFDEIDKKIIN